MELVFARNVEESSATYSEGRLCSSSGGLGRRLVLSTCGTSKEGGGEDGRSHSFVKPHDDVKLQRRRDRARTLQLRRAKKNESWIRASYR